MTSNTVIDILGSRELGAKELIAELQKQTGRSWGDCVRLVKRCLNRGIIRLSPRFLLECAA